MNRIRFLRLADAARGSVAILILASLAACGGGSGSGNSAVASTSSSLAVASDDVSQGEDDDSTSSDATSAAETAMAQTKVVPTFHMAPATLAEPLSTDVGGTNASAHAAPQSFSVDAALSDVDTARLTPQALAVDLAASGRAQAQSATSKPQANTITGAVYTPAQIRAAYGLPDLPATGATVSAAIAASLGAGQTIYLLDAYHDATALSDLNLFSTKFGLPTCTAVTIATTATLPLATPPSSCTFSTVYATATKAMSATAPSYSSSWAPESKLDVQWAHAIAPYARIVLIEMPTSTSTYVLGGLALATAMGPGVVSMSFGSAEASWAPQMDTYFTGTGMTFVAAAGDNGAQVMWPAVGANVFAVGGTSMDWSGSGTRYEAVWSGSGGGVSAYETLPSWQASVKVGGNKLAKRAVPDVAFNADPYTGQYVALTVPGSSTTNWNAYGGTSISSPQWAGLIAVANAERVATAKAVLGDFHAALYTSIGAVPGTYAADFADIVTGSDGSCTLCSATNGFDVASGWGTPNATALLSTLTGVAATTTTAVAPTVPGGSYVGKARVALTQSLGITVPSGVTTTYALSGGPSGLTVDTTGELKWTSPVAGSYTFTATAITSAGKSASGSYQLLVIPGTAPVFSGVTSWSITAGSAFAATLTATNPNSSTLTFTMTSAPSGLTLSTAGALAWATPVAGTYSLVVTVHDAYGYSAARTSKLTVASANHAPTLANATITARVGTAVSTQLQGKDADGDTRTYALTGAPSGATLSTKGVLAWAKATKGTFALHVTVTDTHSATGTGTITLIVS